MSSCPSQVWWGSCLGVVGSICLAVRDIDWNGVFRENHFLLTLDPWVVGLIAASSRCSSPSHLFACLSLRSSTEVLFIHLVHRFPHVGRCVQSLHQQGKSRGTKKVNLGIKR
ncbi:hypothetical protein B0T19DRAFT_297678 [Cercophora scortea]|uniref:Uncharacterized protein n=1 Tax=Cercophora scortea TaxID=314031 RepID=A0AAE0I3N3_9PEZI|nr:hypothetical protein B0T19DRAFT_297678 [Cercophora scortea]